MRKYLLLIISLLFLAGCNSTNNSNLDISTAAKSIEENGGDYVVIEDSTLTDIYDLDLNKMQNYIFKQTENGDFYAIIETKEKTLVKEMMENYFEKVKAFNTSYAQDRLVLWDNVLEKEIGDFLIYIVSQNADDDYQRLLETIK